MPIRLWRANSLRLRTESSVSASAGNREVRSAGDVNGDGVLGVTAASIPSSVSSKSVAHAFEFVAKLALAGHFYPAPSNGGAAGKSGRAGATGSVTSRVAA